MNPVHTLPPYFPKIHCNIFLPSRPSNWSLPFRFSNQNIVFISHLPHACCMSRPSHPARFDRPNNIRCSVYLMKFLNMQSSPAFRHFPPLGSKYSLQHLVLTLNLCFFLSVTEQVLQPYKTTGKFIYILIYKSLDGKTGCSAQIGSKHSPYLSCS